MLSDTNVSETMNTALMHLSLMQEALNNLESFPDTDEKVNQASLRVFLMQAIESQENLLKEYQDSLTSYKQLKKKNKEKKQQCEENQKIIESGKQILKERQETERRNQIQEGQLLQAVVFS